MTSSEDISKPVYVVGNRPVSALHLLQRFAESEVDGIARLSDLHLKIGEPARYRFDGDLVSLQGASPLSEEVLRQLLYPLLTKAQIARLEQSPPRDVDAAFDLPEAELSFRINAFHDREGLACAIRALPRTIPQVESVGFPSDATWQDIVELRQGLVLVTGVTGSGKSTTIASLIQQINDRRRARVVTLEDPIEYVLESRKSLISQRELGRHVASFHEGLRSALREDPDIIVVGEMRDRETTSLALSAAETGHLVFSTLHTKDARGAITRIIDMFPSDHSKELASQLSFSLSYVLGQKLVPRRQGGGRRLVMEVLRNVSATANLIRTGNLHQLYSVMQTQRKEGLSTLEQHLVELRDRGEILAEDALRYANNPAEIAAM